MRVLFAAAEASPLVKTGGLGDVCGSLPVALRRRGVDARLLLPAYPQAVARVEGPLVTVATLELPQAGTTRILEGRLPGSEVPAYLVDPGGLFRREGNPYQGPDGRDWPDNAQRFTALARTAVAVALGRAGLGWTPDLVHAHDWHTGLVPALLAREARRPATVFTVHNLAHQGLFPLSALAELDLPSGWNSMHALEFHGQLSFIKGGLVFADRVTTVSPTYAREVQTPALGCGLDGLFRHRADRVVGVLNGADEAWDPGRASVPFPYSADDLQRKGRNRAPLRREVGLADKPGAAVIAFLGRLVEQKGVDLLVAALSELVRRGAQVVVHGAGEAHLAAALEAASAAHPGRVAVRLGYEEAFAHRLLAGADLLVMPSRFEPCGLVQLYAMRYGTLPIVHRTGGLADTVVDVEERSVRAGTATGFVFGAPTTYDLLRAVDRALDCRARWPDVARAVAATGMKRDLGWGPGAARYVELYVETRRERSFLEGTVGESSHAGRRIRARAVRSCLHLPAACQPVLAGLSGVSAPA